MYLIRSTFYWLSGLLILPSLGIAQTVSEIPIETARTAMVLRVDADRHVTTVHLGKRLTQAADYARLPGNPRLYEGYSDLYSSAYTPAGSRSLLEPAVQATHVDGNPSLDLVYVRHETKPVRDGVTLTDVYLKDPQYPFEVTLHYQAYRNEDVIEQWSTIRHTEKKAIRLAHFASANLYLTAKDYYLTHFHGTHASEVRPEETKLTAGMKVLDSKLGTRAQLFQAPMFMLSMNQPAQEETGDVLAGTLAWSGNFQFAFELDPQHNLRLLAGMNPFASDYSLEPGKAFDTPALIYTFSNQGTGLASRNLQRWARKHRIPQGEGNRLTLLNNWEATYFDFDEPKLVGLFKEAKTLGVDLFLLDDGWFGNNHPRNDDFAGLGDWQANKKKLPHGIGYLVKEAEAAGVKFGIWVEPEMVNPKSDLYQKHPDWVIKLPNRPDAVFRHQQVLDLSNPAVQNFVYGVVDGLLTENPTLGYIKWDCNAVIYNAYSSVNPADHLYVDYVRGLYSVLEKLRAKHPAVPMMLCSGGGARVDYGALNYFTEFWPSDNTSPTERIFIQHNYSYFFPAIATCNHITAWGDFPMKFRTDVAMAGKMGYDIVVSKLSPADLAFSQQALKTYDRLKPVIWQGDQYRLQSPQNNDVSAMLFVSEKGDRAVWFSYLVSTRYKAGTDQPPIRLKGLQADRQYKIREINLAAGQKSPINSSLTYSGDFLMTVGLDPAVSGQRTSVVLEVAEAGSAGW
ncbi:alpha-galactosidase [Fibrella sp. HMF5335]|uniref:Alpha-galactosidase n=1 Tax=Fibrella rubiginis TaxID=2817060 RepID=A0A939GBC3_9BACT|nr:alpha-galactosidase [Fibrella rubiginis]MBO0935236.1 alpha-galactosidase [Fibrella rubiginis]